MSTRRSVYSCNVMRRSLLLACKLNQYGCTSISSSTQNKLISDYPHYAEFVQVYKYLYEYSHYSFCVHVFPRALLNSTSLILSHFRGK